MPLGGDGDAEISDSGETAETSPTGGITAVVNVACIVADIRVAFETIPG